MTQKVNHPEPTPISSGQIRCALNIISKNKAKEVGQFDMLIGATALHYGLTVVTDNIKDFSIMPGVKCVNWVERE